MPNNKGMSGLATESGKCFSPARWGAGLLLGAVMIGCASGPPAGTAGAPASEEELIAGMHIVDCLLPGQLRRLGSGSYLTARRPIKTTASDCNIRGGEYVAYDRADYRTALNVWMPAAEAGDADAQVNVGEIFEKGLGAEPNYEAAVIWYQRAADQGNKRGLFNLATLYEQGLGVEADRVKALNLYREAWGLPEDSVIYQETARREQEEMRARLTQELQTKESQVRLLERQIESLKKQLEGSASREQEAELESLIQLVNSLRESQTEVQQRLASAPRLRTPAQPAEAGSDTPATTATTASAARIDDMDFGRYYALVIGNRDYWSIEILDTPVNDAREIAKVLETQYGFDVRLLIDADRLAIMQAINELHGILGENDNLLLYYAGHGNLVDVGERDIGYWLPINADPPPNDSLWVPNEFITNHLGRLNARRVLVIADSCYGGLLSSSPGHLFFGDSASASNMEYTRYKLPRRSRLLLSSGGDKPVIDSGGGNHSIFAQQLIEVLSSNNRILSAPELFTSINEPVRQRAIANNFVQEPVYKSIRGAGHEVGDFFFVPRDMLKTSGIQ